METLKQTFNSIDERNERSDNSKLKMIKEILERSTGLPMEEIRKRQKLLRCLSYHRYKEFQEMIWIPIDECDWKLWNSTLIKLQGYLWGIKIPSNIINKAKKDVRYTLTLVDPIWNETNKNSKLSEIKWLLEQDSWIWIYKKLKLQRLLYAKKYIEFQQEIWMEKDECDWKLWKSTLETLKVYLKLDKKNLQGRICFCWKALYGIKSHQLLKDPETWRFCCSKTARFNGRQFGISLPRWNAYEALTNPWRNSLNTLPANKKYIQPKALRPAITEQEFVSMKNNINFVDFCTYTKSNYGHRAVWFRDDNWEWYVLDPYTRINWRKNEAPKKLEDYLRRRKIVKAHFYHSSGYTKEW